MGLDPPVRAVFDTNVLFEGLTQKNSASGLLIEAWVADLVRACVSNALAYEYVSVLSRKLSSRRWEETKPVLATLLSLAHFTTIHYSWRPASPDPADDHVVDCAMNAGAFVVTHNRRDFRLAERELGIVVATPLQLIAVLAR